MRGGAVLGHGHFGCVITPAITKGGIPPGYEAFYVSKIANDVGNESEIVKYLSHIENFPLYNYVLPVEEFKVKNLEHEDMEECIQLMHQQNRNMGMNENALWEGTYVYNFVKAIGDIQHFKENAHHYSHHSILNAYRILVHSLYLLHSAGVVHNDIKPENVFYFLDKGMLVFKLADFGQASIRHPAHNEEFVIGTQIDNAAIQEIYMYLEIP